MLTQGQIDGIAEAVLQSLKAGLSQNPEEQAAKGRAANGPVEASTVIPLDISAAAEEASAAGSGENLEDITSSEVRKLPLLDHIEDREGLERMMTRTTARIGVGNCGPRLKTQTMLTLRADHAAARDAVFKNVGQELLDRLGLFTIETRCSSKDEFLTRPDLGRVFPEESLETLRAKCARDVDVQIYASDGLSSTAIEANLENILPVIMDGLKAGGLKTGTPFFVRNGRVAAMDQISETLNARVTCVLIGERPGLATAESMSAYIAYQATVGMPEARRTVVSNIHSKGIPAVEAGAYIVDVIQKILEARASGVELKK